MVLGRNRCGQRLIKDITADASEKVYFVGVGGDRFYFMADDGVHGTELWASDGTTDGTYLIADRNPDGDSHIERPTTATYWDGHFYFYAWHWENGTVNAYPELYRTNGTRGHLEQLTTNDKEGSVLLDYDMIVFQDRLFFTWHNQANGIELWATDGTREGTRQFKDVAPGSSGSRPGRFHLLGDNLLFFALEHGTGANTSLWSSDGTEAGTLLVSRVDPFVLMEDMTLMNGSYYFAGRAHDLNTLSLWTTDGRPQAPGRSAPWE